MTSYLFIPVPTGEMLDIANDLVSAFKKINNEDLKILKNAFDSGRGKGLMRVFSGCLSRVPLNATVYFLLHGSGAADSNFVGASRKMVSVGPKWKEEELAGDELVIDYINARKITRDQYKKLNEEFQARNVKKYTPADVARVLEAEGLPKGFVDLHLLCCGAGLSDKLASIAERVFDSLRNRGYGKIEVTGYEGKVITLENGFTNLNTPFAVQVGSVSFAPDQKRQHYS